MQSEKASMSATVHAVVHPRVQVEILNPRGEVSYRRPINDLTVWQALRTKGYAVRIPKCNNMRFLELLPCVDGRGHRVTFNADGMTVFADE